MPAPTVPPIPGAPGKAVNAVIGALTAWRENRSGGEDGMQSVLNVLVNRATTRGTSIYSEAVRPWQFSSMTAHGDPQLMLWPSSGDPSWIVAQSLAEEAVEGILEDITGGATSYYAASMDEPPAWAAEMTKTVTIAGQLFFRETA
jgi:N-acetylmuramoyl-L-alanine amidase